MSTPQLDLRDAVTDDDALARLQGWLEQQAADAIREHESNYLLADLDPDLIDQYVAADEASAAESIAAALDFMRARLDARRRAQQVMYFVEAHGLWPAIMQAIGAQRDPAAIASAVNAVIAAQIPRDRDDA